jgi:phage repressor protein C with HTH and peptisase S24 domain
MDMYEQARNWLKKLAEEEGGPNRLARRFDTNALKLRRALDKETDPSAASFLSWLENAGVRLIFPDDEEKNLRIVRIPMAGAEIGAGSSFFYDDEEHDTDRYYAFREDFIAHLGIPIHTLKLFRVRGDSMSPEILPGDVLLVQFKEDIIPKDGEMLVVRLGTELLVKTVYKDVGGTLLLRSTNDKWPDITVTPEVEDFQIIGRPRWVGRRL